VGLNPSLALLPQSGRAHKPLVSDAVVKWLLGGDPAIEWQTLRDLTNAKKTEIEAARKEVATKG